MFDALFHCVFFCTSNIIHLSTNQSGQTNSKKRCFSNCSWPNQKTTRLILHTKTMISLIDRLTAFAYLVINFFKRLLLHLLLHPIVSCIHHFMFNFLFYKSVCGWWWNWCWIQAWQSRRLNSSTTSADKRRWWRHWRHRRKGSPSGLNRINGRYSNA